MPSFRSPPVRWPAMRKPKQPAWVRPMQPRFQPGGSSVAATLDSLGPLKPLTPCSEHSMIDRKNRYGRTAARNHDADGLARRPSSATVDIHAHTLTPQAAKHAQPHVDISRTPLAPYPAVARKELTAQEE